MMIELPRERRRRAWHATQPRPRSADDLAAERNIADLRAFAENRRILDKLGMGAVLAAPTGAPAAPPPPPPRGGRRLNNRYLDIGEFRAAVAAGLRPKLVRYAIVGEPVATREPRTCSFVFSDGSVDRYGDTINPAGWVLDNFRKNPIALFGHEDGNPENVIGRAKNVRISGQHLVGDIEFMDGSVNPNAEVVYQMVRTGFLNSVSVGFRPIEYTLPKDRSRQGGIDFLKQELVEISVVSLPANTNAVVEARRRG